MRIDWCGNANHDGVRVGERRRFSSKLHRLAKKVAPQPRMIARKQVHSTGFNVRETALTYVATDYFGAPVGKGQCGRQADIAESDYGDPLPMQNPILKRARLLPEQRK